MLRREALRVHARYLDEVVLGCGLCPWADRVMREGRLRRTVITETTPTPGASFPFIDAIETDEGVDVAFIIYPRLALDAGAFGSYVERLRAADRARRSTGGPPFLLAAFHPHGNQVYTTPFQLVSFLRRTPDPTVQLVRAALLDDLRRLPGDVSGDVTRQNFATVETRGADRLDALLRDIRRDRDAHYGEGR